MKSERKMGIIVGLLFLTSTIAYFVGNEVIFNSIINSPDYLLNVYPNKITLILGMLLQAYCAVAVVGIAVLLFPILRKYNEAVAISYVSFRIIESVILFVGLISALLLIPVSKNIINAGAADISYFHSLGSLAIKGHHFAYLFAMIALGIGSLPFCFLLYRSRLIPRFISVWGIIGYSIFIVGLLLETFDIQQGEFLVIPGGLFEIILPVWLLVKGFNSSTKIKERR